MQEDGTGLTSTTRPPGDARALYAERFQAFGRTFLESFSQPEPGARPLAGLAAVTARSDAADNLIRALWAEIVESSAAHAVSGVALVALGGYGRRELFPYSDVDLLFLLDSGLPEKLAAEPLRRLNQALWDAGLRVSAATRTMADCERFDPANIEAVPALLDARPLAGDLVMARKLKEQAVPRLVARERKRIVTRLLELTRARHARFGNTLFHLEPNVKECPGGLRDAHLCAWLAQLGALSAETTQTALFPESTLAEFDAARLFLVEVRTFLHLRHRRDDNVLDWQSQNEAAQAAGAGVSRLADAEADAAFWMRVYFRQARAVARRTAQAIEDASPERLAARGAERNPVRRTGLTAIRRLAGMAQVATGADDRVPALTVEIRQGDLLFKPRGGQEDSRKPLPVDADLALEAFTAIARTGARLPQSSEERLADALPALAAQLEDGPALRRGFDRILTAPYAGRALRAMHALGVLELFVPEFHGIDALVIRDAYHRYTVDEHTFVVIDTLHALARTLTEPEAAVDGAPLPYAPRFAALLRDLPHRALLCMGALLHDTGKGYAAGEGTRHAQESARLAEGVLQRLEFDPYESGLVLDLIRNHLEMSAALRRDVFDAETIRGFAALVGTPEALRMLTLLTYADISAVHPGALTIWKAENLWHLYIACANFLDRNVEEERIALNRTGPAALEDKTLEEKVLRVRALVSSGQSSAQAATATAALDLFLDGLPRRYLETRSPEQVRAHFQMAQRLEQSRTARTPELTSEVELTYAPEQSELTLVAGDRPLLFALLAGALAVWGMNILTADAFSNAQALAVDSFRFTDTFRTLELNDSERDRFVESVRDVVSGKVSVETLLAGRRRRKPTPPKRVVEARMEVDGEASSHSTIVQVIAQDTPGLLRALALCFAEEGLNIEVALIDTEGEMAIDVFYLTRMGRKLELAETESLRRSLLRAITEHVG